MSRARGQALKNKQREEQNNSFKEVFLKCASDVKTNTQFTTYEMLFISLEAAYQKQLLLQAKLKLATDKSWSKTKV